MIKNVFSITIIVFSLFVLIGCAEIDMALRDTAHVLAPQDVVTGKRTLNIEPEDEEIKRATTQTSEILNELRSGGIGVDTDQFTLSKLQRMMNKITEVSHRPRLPWEIHLIEVNEPNAFTIGGGKLFVYRGLFGGLIDPKDDNELAAVLAHEIAHVNCRHVGKALSLQIASMVSKEVRKEARRKMFQASFTTVQEDEADRVGLLYMALAGYNPTATSKVWMRAHEKYGSDPNDYTYDHSLNIDRLKKISKLIPISMKYFKGQDIRNEDYDRLRVENELIPRTSSFAGESGLLTLLEAALGTYSDYLNAKNEELSRRLSIQQDQIRIMQNVRIINLNIADTIDGYRGVFGKIQSIGNHVINSAEITVYYYNAFGNVIYSEPVLLQNINLWPGYIYDWGTYLKAVSGMQKVGAAVTKIYFAQ